MEIDSQKIQVKEGEEEEIEQEHEQEPSSRSSTHLIEDKNRGNPENTSL